MFDFRDQSVFITGGTRGIGAAITRAFLSAGAEVVANYAQNEEAAATFEKSVDSERLSIVKLDVSDAEAVEAFFDGRSKPFQIVVNNAGIRKDQIVGMMPVADWKRVLEINLDGTFYVCKAAVKMMSRPRYGRIINITSPSGARGFEGQANYAASKAGQVAMAKSLSREVAKRKITVNCVSPGFIDTELLSDLSDEHKKGFLDMVPLKRFGKAEEVAHAVQFLATKEAAYITGTVLEVTGGL